MNATDFRTQHGDPTGETNKPAWTAADYDAYEVLAGIDSHEQQVADRDIEAQADRLLARINPVTTATDADQVAADAFIEAVLLLTGATHQSGPHTAVRLIAFTADGTRTLGGRILPIADLSTVTGLIRDHTTAVVAERRSRRAKARRRTFRLIPGHTPAA